MPKVGNIMIRCWKCHRLIVGVPDIGTPNVTGGSAYTADVLCGCGAAYRIQVKRLPDAKRRTADQVTQEEAERGRLWRGED